jgi:hypothetical protein
MRSSTALTPAIINVGTSTIAARPSCQATTPIAPSCPSNKNWILGAYVGAGANVFITNGRNVLDLSGPFKTFNLQAAWFVKAGGISFSTGNNAAGDTIWVFTFGGPFGGLPTGGGWGASASYYNTNTVTTKGGGKCPCK